MELLPVSKDFDVVLGQNELFKCQWREFRVMIHRSRLK